MADYTVAIHHKGPSLTKVNFGEFVIIGGEFWKGLFPEDESTGEPKAKAAPEKRAAKPSPSV